MKESINKKLSKVKGKINHFLEDKYEAVKNKVKTDESSSGTSYNEPLSQDAKSLETLRREEGDEEGVIFYDTENSEAARGARKEVAKGIDSFGEEDTFDPDEASDNQTYHDRNQNSDLNERYFTRGMDIKSDDMDSHQK